MNEAAINSEIVRSICAIPHSWAWKIPDSSPALRTMERFVPARAFDIAACVHGLTYAIETKLLKTLTGLAFDRLTEFEARSLAAVSAAGGCALLAVAYAAEATPAQMEKHGLAKARVRELHLIPWERWAELEVEARGVGKKSVPRAAVVEAGLSVPWVGKGHWGIEEALYYANWRARTMVSGWELGIAVEGWCPFDASTKGRTAVAEAG